MLQMLLFLAIWLGIQFAVLRIATHIAYGESSWGKTFVQWAMIFVITVILVVVLPVVGISILSVT